MSVRRLQDGGMPFGKYDVFTWVLKNGRWRRDAHFAREVTRSYVDRLKGEPNTVFSANCLDQPGAGCWIAPDDETLDSWLRSEA